jgi:hypothetical protein
MPPKAVVTCYFLAPLRANYMDTETIGAEYTLPEQETPRKPGRSPPIMMISITKFIRLQSDFKDRVKGQYDFRNLFLVILKRNVESQEIFKLNRLNHIIIKVELYR